MPPESNTIYRIMWLPKHVVVRNTMLKHLLHSKKAMLGIVQNTT